MASSFPCSPLIHEYYSDMKAKSKETLKIDLYIIKLFRTLIKILGLHHFHKNFILRALTDYTSVKFISTTRVKLYSRSCSLKDNFSEHKA